jgi:enterochelin esterase-like enzyme
MKKLTKSVSRIAMLLSTWLAIAAFASESDSPAVLEQSEVQDQLMAMSSNTLKELGLNYLSGGDEEEFWEQVRLISEAGNYPIVEEIENSDDAPEAYVRVSFLHKKVAEQPDNVMLFASINHILAEELLFDRIGQTDVYFKTVLVPSGVRFSYRIHENDPLTGLFGGARVGTRLLLLGGDPDPFNPNKIVYPGRLLGRDYIETWVELDGAAAQPYLAEMSNPKGVLHDEEHQSELLGYPHRISSYLPPNYDAEQEYPLLILLDGGEYFSTGFLQTTLENLIADGSIPPVVVLGINAGIKDGVDQRNDEFTCNPLFMEYVNKELLPWFESKYNVSADPGRRIIAGSSFGGLFAAYYAFNHPESVSNVLSQSGSFWWGRDEDEMAYEWLVREFAFGATKPIKFFLEVGQLEAEYNWQDPTFPHQIVSNRHFKTVLDMKGYPVSYQEYGGAHSMLSWRGGIAEGLTQLFNPDATFLSQTKYGRVKIQ